ncbi:hypothetical protein GGR50DRAFT_367533 [Xylaria sp. CBS 124048]|nr:hypothetical protein GGR50DRAFT_367533 [Xylaria sp. CBS 124048]
MANPVQNPQNCVPAVQDLHSNGGHLNTAKVRFGRPNLSVPNDLGYSMQRFVNSHAHIADRDLRPPPLFANTTPLTEDQSRARMTAILAATTAKVPLPARKGTSS